jgi:hypothetical protein
LKTESYKDSSYSFKSYDNRLLIVTRGSPDSLTAKVVNNADKVLQVDSIKLAPDGNITLEVFDFHGNKVLTPFAFEAGDTLMVRVKYTPPVALESRGATIDIKTSDPNFSFRLQVSAVNTALAAVIDHEVPPVSLLVTPNPAMGSFSVVPVGFASGQIEILDVLGRTLSISPVVTRWSPDSPLTPGSYILRIVGKDLTGRPQVRSAKLLVQ